MGDYANNDLFTLNLVITNVRHEKGVGFMQTKWLEKFERSLVISLEDRVMILQLINEWNMHGWIFHNNISNVHFENFVIFYFMPTLTRFELGS